MMNNKEKEIYINKQIKLAKVFRAVISVGMVAPVFVSATACQKEAPAVEESETALPVEKEEQPQPVTQESEADKEEVAMEQEEEAPEETEESTEIAPQAEESQIEFTQDMIKNRLVFPEFMAYLEPWTIAGDPVPLWYVQSWCGDSEIIDEYMASGIVAGPTKKAIGVTGKEELLLPIAFQNPETKEFYVRNLSFGTDEFFQVIQNRGGWPIIFLENYSYMGSYTMTTKRFENIEANFKVGDQIVFSLMNEWDSSLPPVSEEIKNSYEYKVIDEFMSMYFANNKAVYEAMKKNGELPELILNPWIIAINKAEDNN